MRHPLHAICPYFAMFPEDFVARQLFSFTRPGDLVLDPFCGRGTTILESRLNGRRAIGTDVNWVAACVSGAKADTPEKNEIMLRLRELQEESRNNTEHHTPEEQFFSYCFHLETLKELSFLRYALKWKNDPRDRFIAAVALGALHGESHRSPNYLSNRMPRTISTKPEYSIRWWKERGIMPERRDTFRVLADLIDYRLSSAVPATEAHVKLEDARRCGTAFEKYSGQVKLIVTSPPYLDTTDYAEDQWLRLWFLGGAPAPMRRLSKDDRHRNASDYWNFLSGAWRGCAPLLKSKATIVIRIGGRKLSSAELAEGLLQSLKEGLDGMPVEPLSVPVTSEIRRGQINSFRPGLHDKKHEHDFVFRLA